MASMGRRYRQQWTYHLARHDSVQRLHDPRRSYLPRWTASAQLTPRLQVLFAVISSFFVQVYAPFAFHTGIPEIKTILGGYIISGFLSPMVLLVKSLGLPLAVASGLSLGKVRQHQRSKHIEPPLIPSVPVGRATGSRCLLHWQHHASAIRGAAR